MSFGWVHGLNLSRLLFASQKRRIAQAGCMTLS